MNLTPSQAARRAGDTGPEPVDRSVIDILRDRTFGKQRTDTSGFDKELTDRVFMAALRPLAENGFDSMFEASRIFRCPARHWWRVTTVAQSRSMR